jgi:hypothetical protein
MKRIHEFDGALREAFTSGAHDKGVYFVQKDTKSRLIPCSPNKLLFSDVVSIRPGKRLLLSGFQTVTKTAGRKNLLDLDTKINEIAGKSQEPILIGIDQAVELLKLAFANLEFDDSTHDDREAHIVGLEHLSKISKKADLKGKVWLILARDDRGMRRYREEGRFSNAPDTKQQNEIARNKASDIPVLLLLRQKGDEGQGWRGLPFWWPVILTPKSGATVIFSTDEAVSAEFSNSDERSLSVEENENE